MRLAALLYQSGGVLFHGRYLGRSILGVYKLHKYIKMYHIISSLYMTNSRAHSLSGTFA